MSAQVQFSSGPRFHPRSAPVTFWLLVVTVLIAIAAFFGGAAVTAAIERLIFVPELGLQQPWTMLTYPVIGPFDPISLFFIGYVLWWSGADTERWWGSLVHGLVLLAVTVAVALLFLLAHTLNPTLPTKPAYGLMLPMAVGLTIWCLRHLNAPVYLLFIPVTGWLILLLEVAFTWWRYGPYFGFFAVLGAIGLPAAYYYWGHHLHRFGARLGLSPEARERRQRNRRFKKIVKQSNLRLVDDDEPRDAAGGRR